MPPHIRCILSTRCILTHSHSYVFKRIQMHSLTHAFTCVRRCIHIQVWRWRLGWHVVAHGCFYGTPYGMPTARPAHIRPSEFGLESARLLLCKYVCGPWCILVHSDAFWRIHVHSGAFLSIMKRVRSRPGAHRNRVFFLLSALEYITMHLNASQVECSTFKMHQAENVLECVIDAAYIECNIQRMHMNASCAMNARECNS
jgi:hypothetical protein